MPLPPEPRQRTQLALLIAQGLSASEMARQLRVSRAKVYRLVKEYGLPLVKQPRGGQRRGKPVTRQLASLTDAEVRELLVRHRNSLSGLAEHLGVSKGGVYNALAKRNIHSTNPGGMPSHQSPAAKKADNERPPWPVAHRPLF